MSDSHDVLVLGGGIIGLSCAWQLVRDGYSVAVVDREPGRGAAWAAAGMLAPASEAHFGEEDQVRLLAEGARTWGAYAEQFSAASGAELGYLECGSLLVGLDGGDKAQIERAVELQRSFGYQIDDLDLDRIGDLEPSLTSHLRVAKLAPEDHQVNPRLVLETLLGVLHTGGVDFVRASAVSLELEGAQVRINTEDGATHRGNRALLALGAYTNQLRGLEQLATPSIRPVKGHIVRLFGEPLLSHVVRGMVRGRSVYLVPRSGGELVIGASTEEKGFDTTVQMGEVFRLLDDARQLIPGIDELELREASCGLRPAPRDNLPVVDWLVDEILAIATGHYRNGVLLAPLTARVVGSMFQGSDDPARGLFGGRNG
jgi:glycine oxidase